MMNNSLLSLGCICAAGAIFTACQEPMGAQSEASAEVRSAFEEKFPQAKDVQWEQTKTAKQEAEFTLNGEEMSATFSQDGTWLETESEIEESDFPRRGKRCAGRPSLLGTK